jgi:glutamyl-tRNA synthetase
MTIITRFAPSPTGYLHIGGARTALFNWLYTKHMKGKFYLRIEDTDRERSTQEAVDAIYRGLEWLGLAWDGEPVLQFARADRHREVAYDLLSKGHAYKCFCTTEELEEMKKQANERGVTPRYNGMWRDKDPADAPAGKPFVIRLKSQQTGETVIEDLVQGEVKVLNKHLDDMVLLRSDGNPTYMLSVVVDDHDMGITHVIRGDDHLTNTFRQVQIYQASGWDIPVFSHIPLIHGADGAKLSKRHGAVGIETYKDRGYLPEALRNYLMRLGWSHGDDEIISTEQAIEWFDVKDIGRSPSRLDFAKLDHVNGHYIREAQDERLTREVITFLQKDVSDLQKSWILKGMPGLKQRAKTLVELAQNADFYAHEGPIEPINDKAKAALTQEAVDLAKKMAQLILSLEWTSATDLEEAVKAHTESLGMKMGAFAQALRVMVTGRTISPPLFDVIFTLGAKEFSARVHLS